MTTVQEINLDAPHWVKLYKSTDLWTTQSHVVLGVKAAHLSASALACHVGGLGANPGCVRKGIWCKTCAKSTMPISGDPKQKAARNS